MAVMDSLDWRDSRVLKPTEKLTSSKGPLTGTPARALLLMKNWLHMECFRCILLIIIYNIFILPNLPKFPGAVCWLNRTS
jgi:hypothetical protein